jgi:hypothetical protein
MLGYARGNIIRNTRYQKNKAGGQAIVADLPELFRMLGILVGSPNKKTLLFKLDGYKSHPTNATLTKQRI